MASIEGLVLLKLYAGGPQDLWDIEQLRGIGGAALDTGVDRRIEALPDHAREAWTRVFPSDVPLAVRSSGTKEDLEGASFAGQYETVLGVRASHAVFATVEAALRSARSGQRDEVK